MYEYMFLGRSLLKHNTIYEKEIEILVLCSRTASQRRVPTDFAISVVHVLLARQK